MTMRWRVRSLMLLVAGVGLTLAAGFAVKRMIDWSDYCRQRAASHARQQPKLKWQAEKSLATIREKPAYWVFSGSDRDVALNYSLMEHHARLEAEWAWAASHPWTSAPPDRPPPPIARLLIDLRTRNDWNSNKLDLSRSGATDQDLALLRDLKWLRRLSLSGTEITDAGMKHLAALTDLEELGIGETGITDAGLKQLSGLTGLKALSIARTGITDAGLKSLVGMTKLQKLTVFETKVTRSGVREFCKAVPQTQVTHDP